LIVLLGLLHQSLPRTAKNQFQCELFFLFPVKLHSYMQFPPLPGYSLDSSRPHLLFFVSTPFYFLIRFKFHDAAFGRIVKNCFFHCRRWRFLPSSPRGRSPRGLGLLPSSFILPALKANFYYRYPPEIRAKYSFSLSDF